jgi:hypothetical protein
VVQWILSSRRFSLLSPVSTYTRVEIIHQYADDPSETHTHTSINWRIYILLNVGHRFEIVMCWNYPVTAPHLAAPLLHVSPSVIKYTQTDWYRFEIHCIEQLIVCAVLRLFSVPNLSMNSICSFNFAFGIAHHISARIGVFLLLSQYSFVFFFSLLCGNERRMMILVDINIIWISQCAELDVLVGCVVRELGDTCETVGSRGVNREHWFLLKYEYTVW